MRGDDVGVEALLRAHQAAVLGGLVRRFGDLAACEDAVQEALLAGATAWTEGVPRDPRGWLARVAHRRMVDRIRSEIARRDRESRVADEHPVVVAPAVYVTPAMHPDDSLILVFMCCHPALSTSSAIALTLRAVGGLSTREIAAAYLVPEATMAQRLSRARRAVRGEALTIDDPAERLQRLQAVMHVLYLIFNEGYAASEGERLVRATLVDEAIRLARLLRTLVPDDPEVAGLLALMLLTDARRDARVDASGALVPLDEQDRSRWDGDRIAEGTALVDRAWAAGRIGPYQLQAAIAAVHDAAPSFEATDWPEILALYGVLRRLRDHPVVELNHAVALAMVHGPQAGLDRLDALAADARLAGYHRLTAARAHLLRRAGRHDEARRWFLTAAEQARSEVERDYLLRQADALRAAR